MNYATLFKTIQGYVENDFPAETLASSTGSGTVNLTAKEQIDTFIKQAEQRIYNSVQFPNFRKNQTGTTTGNNKYLATPVDFLAPYSLAVRFTVPDPVEDASVSAGKSFSTKP